MCSVFLFFFLLSEKIKGPRKKYFSLGNTNSVGHCTYIPPLKQNPSFGPEANMTKIQVFTLVFSCHGLTFLWWVGGYEKTCQIDVSGGKLSLYIS